MPTRSLFCVLFALVPFALFVVALLGFLDLTVLWTRDVAPGVAAIVGPSAFGVLDETVGQILATRQGYWLTAGLALTIWELSNAVFAVGGALNRIYRMSEERPLWRQLGESIVLGVAAGTCLLGTLAVAQVVPALVERTLGPGAFASVLGFIAQWGVAVAAMLLVVSILIRYACRARQLALGEHGRLGDRWRLDPHFDRLQCLHQRLGQLRLALRALRSFEWTPGACSAKEVPASEPVYGREQANGTCTSRLRADLGDARRGRVAYGRRPARAVRWRC
jgi:hypothetical protein